MEDLNCSVHPSHAAERKASVPAIEHEESRGRKTTFDQILKDLEYKDSEAPGKKARNASWYSKMARPKIKTSATAPPGSFSSIHRTVFIAFLIACVVPGFRYSTDKEKVNISGADAGVIMRAELVENGGALEGRQNSPTDVCTRWSHMGMFYTKIWHFELKTDPYSRECQWNSLHIWR